MPRPNFGGGLSRGRAGFRRACYSGLMPASQPHSDAFPRLPTDYRNPNRTLCGRGVELQRVQMLPSKGGNILNHFYSGRLTAAPPSVDLAALGLLLGRICFAVEFLLFGARKFSDPSIISTLIVAHHLPGELVYPAMFLQLVGAARASCSACRPGSGLPPSSGSASWRRLSSGSTTSRT